MRLSDVVRPAGAGERACAISIADRFDDGLRRGQIGCARRSNQMQRARESAAVLMRSGYLLFRYTVRSTQRIILSRASAPSHLSATDAGGEGGMKWGSSARAARDINFFFGDD